MKRSSSRPGLALVAGMLLAVGAMTLYGRHRKLAASVDADNS